MSGEELAARLAAVQGRIEAAAVRAGRDARGVTLVGVSKRKSAAELTAAIRSGLRAVGESYVQEALPKLAAVSEELAAEGLAPPRWHFIGRLQRNKARQVVRGFDVVETVDSEALGAELNRRAQTAERPLEILIQVNVAGEVQKGGVSPAALPALLAAGQAWGQLRATGLMTIPPAAPDPEASRPVFAALRELARQARAWPGGESLRELSMGMSADFETAIEEGATLVRVGTAIFGERS